MTRGRTRGSAGVAALLAITALAALLRFTALDYGGSVWAAHPDEFNVVTAIEAAHAGTLSRFHVAYGGGYVYPLSAAVRAFDLAAGTPDAAHADGERDFVGRPYATYLRARAWSAAASVLTVALTGLVGARVAGWPAGILAAGIVAAAPVSVLNAHIAKADSACALASVLLLLALCSGGPPWRQVLSIGLAAGLAASVKYHVGPLPAVAIALLTLPASGARRRIAHLAAGAAIALLVAGALNSFWLWAPSPTLAHFRAVARSQFAYVGEPWFAGLAVSPLVYHATVSLRFGCGLASSLLSLPALLAALASKERTLRLFALVLAGDLLVLAANPLTLSRNFLPLVPALAVLIGHLVARAADRVGRYRPAVLATAAFLLVVVPLGESVRVVQVLRADDTRTLLQRWIAARVPEGATIMIGQGSKGAPQFGLPGSGIGLAQGNRRVAPFSLDRPLAAPAFLVWYESPLPFTQGPLPDAAADLEVLADFDPSAGPTDAVYDVYDAFFAPLAGAHGIERPGPRIRVLAVPERPARR